MQFGSEEEAKVKDQEELVAVPLTSMSQRKPVMGHDGSMSTLYPNE